jgi:hypothetical protein
VLSAEFQANPKLCQVKIVQNSVKNEWTLDLSVSLLLQPRLFVDLNLKSQNMFW